MDRREFFRLSFGAIIATKLGIPEMAAEKGGTLLRWMSTHGPRPIGHYMDLDGICVDRIPPEYLRAGIVRKFDFSKVFAPLISDSELRVQQAENTLKALGPIVVRKEG